jgi:hypothetical protein
MPGNSKANSVDKELAVTFGRQQICLVGHSRQAAAIRSKSFFVNSLFAFHYIVVEKKNSL